MLTVRSLDSQICGICGVLGEVYLGDGNQKNCCSRNEVCTFLCIFLQITSPTSLAFKSVIFFHFRLILQCQWQGEVSIPQIYAIIKSLNCQDYNKGLSYHRNMHFKITWCDNRASGGWFFCNTPVVTVCCYLANTCFVDCITSRLYFSCVCSLICYSNIEILLEQRWLCSKMLSLLVSIENNKWVGSKS